MFFTTIIFFCNCENSNELSKNINKTEIDSISYWINQSKSSKFTIDQKEKLLVKAYQNLQFVPDSLRNKYLGEIAIETGGLNNNDFFKKTNRESLIIATKLKDFINIGSAHWNYGNYYTDIELVDSAYFHFNKAYENFEEANHNYWAANMLYNMAFIQGRLRDYTGSELLIFEAISKLENENRPNRLSSCYNYLGLI